MAKKFDVDCDTPNKKLLTFQALADEKRLKVLELIRDGEKNGTYLRNELDIPQSSLSYHMKLLCDSGIVIARNQGKSTFYRINGEKSHNEADLLAKLLSDENANAKELDDRHSFAFGMSHDVRTPINAILSYAELAENHIDDRERTLDCLEKIRAAGGQLLTLTDEVLEMAKLASSDLIIEEMPSDLRFTAREIREEIEKLAEDHEVEFAIYFNNVKNHRVLCDYVHLNEVLLKLLDNAIRFSEPGGRVDLLIEQKNCNLEGYSGYDFTVRDEGCGMSPEFLPHACEPFSRERTDGDELFGGAGLGLTIAKKMVGLLGGSLEVRSEKHNGTSVTVHLMMKLQPEGEEESDAEEAAAALEGKRLLLVEENEMNRDVLREMLEEDGLLVEEASDGDVAVAMVKENPAGYYDGILMALLMPRMDGFTATRLIRNLPDKEKAEVPIIAVSASSFKRDRNKAMAVGMNDFFPKPINRKGLRDTLQKYLSV